MATITGHPPIKHGIIYSKGTARPRPVVDIEKKSKKKFKKRKKKVNDQPINRSKYSSQYQSHELCDS